MFSTPGCFMMYNTYDEPQQPPSKTDQIQKAVSDYTKSKIEERGVYRGFLYGEVFVTKAKEIQELDQLIEIRNQLPTMEDHYGNRLDSVIAEQDRLIEAKKNEIKVKKLYPLYELSHLFSVALTDKVYEIYEFDFSVYPNYSVKDVRQLMQLQLNQEQYKQFVHFMQQRPLTDNYQVDVAYYTQFFTALDNEKKYKAELLLNILKITQHIIKHGNFDQHLFCRSIAEEWMKNNNQYPAYKGIGFNPFDLQPLLIKNDQNIEQIIGYTLNHQFQFSEKAESATSELKFEFDLNFLLTRVYTP
jgi:hypothetical protein